VRDMNYRPREVRGWASFGGQLFEANRDVLSYNADATLSYFRRIGEQHNIDALAGTEYRFSNWEQFSATGRNFPSGLFRTMNLAATPFGVAGSYTEYKMASLFSQVRYDFDGRYLLSGSVRYDGSSRFGADTKYGLFYAVSFGWEATRERFLADNPVVSLLRPRVSIGTTGNSQIADFAARSLFGSGGSYNEDPALRPTQLGNNILTWEEAQTINLGLDYGFFNNRVFGSIEAYRRRNNELLLARQLPLDSGFASINENVGVVENRGLEFEITTINLDLGGFRWTSDFNIAFLQNEVISLNEGQTEIGDIVVGRSLGAYRVQNFAGVNPADGRSMWYDKDGNITYSPVDADRIWAGDIYPDYWGGLGNTFSYAGLSLSTFFQFNIGQETFLQQQGFFLRDPSFQFNLERIAWERAWNQPGDMTDTPKLVLTRAEPGIASNITSSNRLIEDVSYIRLKNVQLSYAVPAQFTRQAGFQGVTIFAQAQNLLTWTAFSGIDPEMWGTQNAIYPQNKVYTMGLQVQF
jgi:TonB-dependent starch-binding outer membrane protein SusC